MGAWEVCFTGAEFPFSQDTKNRAMEAVMSTRVASLTRVETIERDFIHSNTDFISFILTRKPASF